MLGAGFSDDAFRERVTHMLDRVARTQAGEPVASITITPHFWDFADADHTQRFRAVLWEVHAELGLANARLIEGPELLSDLAGLTGDLLHPGDHGMIQIGERLAAKLKPMLDG